MMKPKIKRAAVKRAPLLRLGYYILDLVQSPFDWLFWLIEKPKSRLWQRLYNRGRIDR
jgi:hypothetical protein